MNKEEAKIQQQIILYWNHNFTHLDKCLFAVNNNSGSRISGAINKALGVKTGISDLILILPNTKILFIEIKTPNGKQSKDQINFESLCKQMGHIYIIIRSLEEFTKLPYISSI